MAVKTDERVDEKQLAGAGGQQTGNQASGGGNPKIERVTVNLSPRSSAALAQIVGLTGDRKTDAIGKALQAYAMIQAAQAQGGAMWIQDDSSADPARVHIY